MSKKTRWYSGFSYKGKPQTLVTLISQKVNDYDLSKYIPLIRIEKKAKKGQFYFFVAIESEQPGEHPSQVKDYLIPLPCFQYPIKGKPSFTYEEIKPMVGVAHEVHDYTNPIPYEVAPSLESEDPFASFWVSYPAEEYQLESAQKYQDLLYWLSAYGRGSWELFKQVCQTLNILHPTRVIRRLKLLGHLETSANGKQWSIAPTTLVHLNSAGGCSNFILCGQQSPILLKQLKRFAKIYAVEQHLPYAPSVKIISFSESIVLTEVIDTIKQELGLSIYNAGNAALTLSSILPSLKEWQLGLNSLPGIVNSLYDWKYYQNGDFIPCSLPQLPGLYQMWSSEKSDKPILTIFYEAQTDTWRQGDWYGLRFLALQIEKQECIARYEKDSLRLAIPCAQRWPELYERALVLASGKLPKYKETEGGNLWLIYENISFALVEILTQKLGVIC
jgi:hypothetical protein